MVKLVQCIHRRPRLGVEEFRAAWEEYGEHLRAVAIELGAISVSLSTTLETPLNDALAEARGSALAFDGIAEVAWPSGAAVLGERKAPGTRERIESLRAMQEKFVDHAGSSFFFVHEQELLAEQGDAKP